jgi:hypothetical protein
MRFELTTLTLARLCSTPELRPRSIPSDTTKRCLSVTGDVLSRGVRCKWKM